MKFWIGNSLGLLAIALTGAAHAADLSAPPMIYKGPPPAPSYMWQGFYLGANGGFAWGSSCWTFIDTAPPGLGGPPATEGCHTPDGGVIGGQVGYNWQLDHWL